MLALTVTTCPIHALHDIDIVYFWGQTWKDYQAVDSIYSTPLPLHVGIRHARYMCLGLEKWLHATEYCCL